MKEKIAKCREKLKDPIVRGFIATLTVYAAVFAFILSMEFWPR